MTTDGAPDLSQWNALGREVCRQNCATFEAVHVNGGEATELTPDPRSPEMGEAVLREVIAMNVRGQGRDARGVFDPAYSPFVPGMDRKHRGLSCCAILGPETYLVQQGASYQRQSTWYISGDTAREVAGVLSFAWSRNRRWFAMAQVGGDVTLGAGFESATEVIWRLKPSDFLPDGLPEAQAAQYTPPGDVPYISRLSVSDDGTRVLICDEGRGVVLLAKVGAGWQARLIYPSVALGLVDEMARLSEEGEAYDPFLQMLHMALSPDGRFAAVGTQEDGHHIVSLGEDGTARPYATLGGLSEYPHNACFSDESDVVALNSCHIYNGRTFVSTLAGIEGLQTEFYDIHDCQTVVNETLRVYASGYVPPEMAGQGAFLLGGAGTAICVSPEGYLLWEIAFGSSCGGVDICTATGQILIASYSGMLHVLDPHAEQSVPINYGIHVPNERRRWIIWDRLERPIQW